MLLDGLVDLMGWRSRVATVILLVGGGLALGYGGWNVVAAHPADPVEVTGTVATYFREDCGGRDCKLFMTMAGDPDPQHRYEINAGGGLVVPSPEDGRIRPGTAIALWYDRGTSNLLGLSLGEPAFARPQMAADWYRHPSEEYDRLRTFGLFFIILGAVIMAMAGLYECFVVLPARRKRLSPGR